MAGEKLEMTADPKAGSWTLWALLILVGPFYFLGLRWGLPSNERRDLVLHPRQETQDLYDSLSVARDQLYKTGSRSLDSNPTAIHREKEKFHEQPLHSIGSFLIRSLDGDEQATLVALSTLKTKRKPEFYNYGTLYLSGVGLTLLCAQQLGKITLSPDIRFYYRNPNAMANIYFWARTFSALSGLLCAILLYRLTRRLMSPPWSLVATLLFCLAPVNLFLTHVMKPHLLSTAFALAGFNACVDLMNAPNIRNYIKSGILFGLAVGMTINLWPLPLFIAVIHFSNTNEKGQADLLARSTDLKLWIGMSASIAAYFLSNPFILMNPHRWWREMTFQSGAMGFTLSWRGIPSILKSVPLRGLGLAPIGLVFLGIIISHRKRSHRFEKPLLYFLGIYSILFTAQLKQWAVHAPDTARYFVPGLALMTVIAGWTLEKINFRSQSLAISLAILCVFISLERSVFAVMNCIDDNPRTAVNMQAGRWINSHLKPGTRIGALYNLLTYRHPPFHFLDYDIDLYAPQSVGSHETPEYFILDSNPNLYFDPTSPPIPNEKFRETYQLERVFVWDKADFYTEYFSGANYPLWIFKHR